MEFEEKFDTDDYADTMLWVTAGATHVWDETGGWSGGCAKFTPPTSEGYAGLANFGSVSARKVNARFLFYMGSEYTTGGNNKLAILMRSPYADGTRQIAWLHENSGTFRSVMITQSAGDGDSSYPDGVNMMPYEGQWICLEMESDLDANTSAVYLTTQDLVYNETPVVSYANASPETGVWSSIQIIGGYYQEMPEADPNRYFKIDELKISTSGYIGPPAGFGGGSPSQSINQLNIQSVVSRQNFRKIHPKI